MKTYKQFIFSGYEWSNDYRTIALRYALDDEIHFTETFTLDIPPVTQVNQGALAAASQLLHLMAGTSYYKTYLPEDIVLQSGGLTQSQADFFSTVYRHGFGEFYVRNNLTPPDRIAFPVAKEAESNPVQLRDLTGILVPFGGGKDSIVTAETLKEAGCTVTTWTVRVTPLLQPGIDRMKAPHIAVERHLDPQLADLTAAGAYNGHVPITGILSALAVITAILTGKKDIALSNEASAGEGNVEHHGLAVNHQYSKTLEFEQALQKYIRDHISPDIRYFSFLRPLSELKIAEIFTGRYLEKYTGAFISCNRNFKFGNEVPLSWCGECPKCAFIYLLFSPFVPKTRLMDLFHGKNLFADPNLKTTFEELLGISGHKPFECVGEIRECRQAAKMALATGEYPELAQFTFPAFEYDYEELQPSSMPESYLELLKSALFEARQKH